MWKNSYFFIISPFYNSVLREWFFKNHSSKEKKMIQEYILLFYRNYIICSFCKWFKLIRPLTGTIENTDKTWEEGDKE